MKTKANLAWERKATVGELVGFWALAWATCLAFWALVAHGAHLI